MIKRNKKIRATRAGMKSRKVATKSYVANALRRREQKEFHYFDTFQGDTNVSTYVTPFRLNLFNPAEGTTTKSRLGKKVQLLSMNLNIAGYINSNSVSHDRMRVAIVQIKRSPSNTGTDYQYNFVYDTQALNVTQGPMAYRNIAGGNLTNFKILKQWDIDLGYNHLADKGTFTRRFYKKWKKPLTVWFDTSSAAYPIENNIFVVACSDNSSFPPLLAVQSRITFLP